MRNKHLTMILIMMALTILIVAPGYAQKIAYQSGDKVGQVGLGINYTGIYGSSTLPPISAAFEIARTDNWGVGGFLAFAGSEETWKWYGEEYGWDYTYIGVGGRMLYHYGVFDHEKVDTYVGLALGYNIVSASVIGLERNNSASSSFLMYGGFLGGRYYFRPNMSVFTEFGYGGLGVATVGLSLQF
jgi:hypothetical protein